AASARTKARATPGPAAPSEAASPPRARAAAAPDAASSASADTKARKAAVAVGKKVPAFTAEATGGRKVSSKSLAGKPYVLYFYPKDDTPGCTTEGRDFAAQYDAFRRLGVEVLGVSRDSLASHEKFKAKHGLPFDLISDPDEKLCNLF